MRKTWKSDLAWNRSRNHFFSFPATGYVNIARSLLPARIGVLGRVAPNLVVVVVVVVTLP